METRSFWDLYADERNNFLERCDLCGICIDVCPSAALTSLKNNDSTEIQSRVMDFLKSGTVSEEISIKVASCMHCAVCQDVCPQGINPLMTQELLQLELVRRGLKRHPLWEIKVGDKIFFLPDILASMQIKPEEKCWVCNVPDNPDPTEIVVFTGCSLVTMPDIIFIISDILKTLELNFVIVAGGELCCGAQYLGVDPNKSQASCKKLLHALNSFHPKKVLFCCAGCVYQLSRYWQRIAPVPFEYDELFHFLAANVDRLKFVQTLEKTVTLHDPCSIAKANRDSKSLRTLLTAIPGIRLIEMQKNRENAICCGAVTSRYSPHIAQSMVTQCLDMAANTKAELLVDACVGCHLQFCPEEYKYTFQVINFFTLLGECMGIRYEDRVRKYFKYGNIDQIIKEAEDNINASHYNSDLTAYLANRFFIKC